MFYETFKEIKNKKENGWHSIVLKSQICFLEKI